MAWGVVLGMAGWGLWLNFAWARAASLPMQWGLDGRPTWFASRAAAVGFIPALAVLVVGAITVTGGGGARGGRALAAALLLLGVQVLWVVLARRYV